MAYSLDSLSEQHKNSLNQTSPSLSPTSSTNLLDDSAYQVSSRLVEQHDSLPASLSFCVQLYGAEPSPIKGYTKDQLQELLNSQGLISFLYGDDCRTDQQISIAIKKKVMKTYKKHGFLKAMQKYQYLNARSHMEDKEVRETDIYYVRKAIEAYTGEQLNEPCTHKSIDGEKRVLKIPDPMFIIRKEGEHAHSFSQDYADNVTNFCKINVNRLGAAVGDLCCVIEQVFVEKVVCHRGSIIVASQCILPYHGIIDGIIDFNGLINAQVDPRKVASLLEPHLGAILSIEKVISLDFCKYVTRSLLLDLRNTTRLLSAMLYISNSEKTDTTAMKKWAYFTGGVQLDTRVVVGYFRTPNEILCSMVAPYKHVFVDFQDSFNSNGWDVQGFIERTGDKCWIIADSIIFPKLDFSQLNIKNDASNSINKKRRKIKQQTQIKQNQHGDSIDDNGYQKILKEDLICHSLDTLLSMRQSMSKDQSDGKLIDQTKYNVINDLILNNIFNYTDTSPDLDEKSHANKKVNISFNEHLGELDKGTQETDIKCSIPKSDMQKLEPICQGKLGSTTSDASIGQMSEEEGLKMMGSVAEGDSGWACWKILKHSLPCCKGSRNMSPVKH